MTGGMERTRDGRKRLAWGHDLHQTAGVDLVIALRIEESATRSAGRPAGRPAWHGGLEYSRPEV
jgi:hypothetical protein